MQPTVGQSQENPLIFFENIRVQFFFNFKCVQISIKTVPGVREIVKSADAVEIVVRQIGLRLFLFNDGVCDTI